LEKLYESDFKLKGSNNLNITQLTNAIEFLGVHEYEKCIELLQKLLLSAPLETDYYFYVALAMFKGRHPKTLSFSEANSINKYLEKACYSKSPKAHYFYLWAFIKANFYLANGFRVPEPSIEETLLSGEQYPVDNYAVKIMLQHIPSENSILDVRFKEI
jgi:hypothetical protein